MRLSLLLAVLSVGCSATWAGYRVGVVEEPGVYWNAATGRCHESGSDKFTETERCQ